MRRGTLAGAAALLLAVTLAACASPGPYSPYARPGGAPMQQAHRTVILDSNVQDALLLVNTVQKRLPRGEILVQANYQNRYAKDDVWADVKFEFYDGNGMVVDETEWVKTHFPALEVTMVQGSSISTSAAKHVMLMKNLYTATGRRPIGRGKIFEIRSSPSILPR